MIWLLPHQVDRRHTGRQRKRDKWREREGGGGGRAKSYEGERAWYSINHSLLSDFSVVLHNQMRLSFSVCTVEKLYISNVTYTYTSENFAFLTMAVFILWQWSEGEKTVFPFHFQSKQKKLQRKESKTYKKDYFSSWTCKIWCETDLISLSLSSKQIFFWMRNHAL